MGSFVRGMMVLAVLSTVAACDSENRRAGSVVQNQAPVARIAPAALTVDEGTPVTLDGGGSSDAEDGSTLTYAWRRLSGPAPQDPGSAGASTFVFTAPAVSGPQILTIELQVTDSGGRTAATTAVITIRDAGGAPPPNSRPTASVAPASQTVDEGATVTLTSGSLDAEDASNLTHEWTRVSGPEPANPGVANASTYSFTAPAVDGQQVIVVQLRVVDSGGLADTTTASVTVRDTTLPPTGNTAPVASAGPDQGATEGATVVLDGGASDDAEDGAALVYAWTQADGPAVSLNGANGAVASFTAPEVNVPTPVTLRLTVTDTEGAQGADDVVVTVAPAAASAGFFETQCLEQGGPAPLCAALGQAEAGQPDVLPLASYPTPRGGITTLAQAARAPSAKSVDGNPADWIGTPTRIGGTQRLDAGEHIYSDYIFDAYGADDGVDQQRLALLDPLAEVEPRTFRFDQLFQAAGDQFDAPAPIGAADRYGDTTVLGDEADVYELRWAASSTTVYLLARYTALTDPAKAALLLLLDTGAGPDGTKGVGFGSGLSTGRFDKAVLLTADGAQIQDLATGDVLALGGVEIGIGAAGWTNSVEAGLPAALFAPVTAVAVVSGRRTEAGLTPANVAYRAGEPVAGVYSDKAQALSLLDGNVDAFSADLNLAGLRAGVTESFALTAGYVERQFAAGENISREGGEDGLIQHYGLYVPTQYRPDAASPLTFWLHYRGGKAHSGAAWTPRLVTSLGEEHGNIVATPRGRGTSTWYTTQAHQDFFEVFADVAGSALIGDRAPGLAPAAALLNVDAARVYLSGYSMGGYGTYLFGLLYPDLFAGGYSTSGAVTQGLWTGFGPDREECEAPQEEIPEVGEANLCFGEANDSRANAQLNFRILENARDFPIVIHHGTDDELVPISGVQRMGARLLELGYRYQLATFFGYEHYTQAIIDEWRDGATYLNRFSRPANPRSVTYKVVPALVDALNEVQEKGKGPFTFAPDGAYWVDGVGVFEADASDPTQSGQLDAESFALAGKTVAGVPHVVDADPPTASTPAVSPGGHSTPYLRHGQDWVETGDAATANGFRLALTNLATASVDLARMNLDLAQPVTGVATASFVVDTADAIDDGQQLRDAVATLTLTNVAAPVQVFVNGQSRSGALQGNRIVLQLRNGASLIQLLPPGAPAPAPGLAGTPTLAAACLAAAAPAGALCDAIGAATSTFVDGCGDFASAGFCSTFGGNLHGIIDGCREQGGDQAELLCKFAEQFVFSLASACGAGGAPAEFCALLSGQLLGESPVAAFEAGWTAQALRLQRALGATVPLHDADFPATHNSFNNTDANTPPTLSGSDSNQKYSFVDQLRMGIRAIELDVHWWFSADGAPEAGGRGPVLCHATEPHIGCTTERPFAEGLAELRAWLDDNADDVMIFYLEAHLDEDGDDIPDGVTPFDTTAAQIEAALGTGSAADLIYRPAQHDAQCNDDLPITNPTTWINLTSQQIRDAGKQVLIFTGTCGQGSAWPALAHNKRNAHYEETSSDDYTGFAYPDCRIAPGEFSVEDYATKWTRFFEDSTLVTLASGGGAPRTAITPDNVREMVRCGVNMPSLDQLTPTDGRMEAFVWSWAVAEPDASPLENCARHGADGRFAAESCTAVLPFACVRAGDGAWAVGSPAGPWSGAACPPGHVFGVPRSGNHNQRLQDAKAAAGVAEVWLNYTDAGTEGSWIATP